MDANASKLILFTLGEGPDHQGRLIDDIRGWNNEALESTHDYIQWLFPIPEKGEHNDFAPVLTETSMLWFSRIPDLREQQTRSFHRMLNFFGLKAMTSGFDAGVHLNERHHPWLRRFDHNHRRISRIIRSLHLCHQPELAASFRQVVTRIGQQQGDVSDATVRFWNEATA
jgi:hypothetical protein